MKEERDDDNMMMAVNLITMTFVNFRLTDSTDEYSAGSMMCTAISKGDHADLTRLLKNGLHPDSGDYDRRRALHVASAAGYLRAIKILLDFEQILVA